MARRSIQRLNQVIKERAAKIVLHELSDPRLGFVTITRAELSDDQSYCKIFYSVMGETTERNKTSHVLKDARGFIQKRIGEGLRTRTIPHMTFEYDESIEGAMRMGSLLRKLAEEREDRQGPDDSETPPESDPGTPEE